MADYRKYTKKEIPAGWFPIVIQVFNNTEDEATSCLNKVKTILDLIYNYDPKKNWPTEDEWKKMLPDWLLDSFHYMTKDELEGFLESGKSREEIGWHYGSWLWSLETRVWEYIDVKQEDKVLYFVLLVDGHPYSVKAFEHLVEAAGALKVVDL